jgi:Zinc finger, C3HC4 type (RING finger)
MAVVHENMLYESDAETYDDTDSDSSELPVMPVTTSPAQYVGYAAEPYNTEMMLDQPDESAVLGAFSSNYSCFDKSVQQITHNHNPKVGNDILCKVCYTNILQSVCSPCGHAYMCLKCVKQHVDRKMPACCGICKVGISDIYQVKL